MMKKRLFLSIVCSTVALIILSSTVKVLSKSKVDYFPEYPSVNSSTIDGLPYVRTLPCVNSDVDGVEHYAAYIIAYDYETRNEQQLEEKIIDATIDHFFDEFKMLFESFSYEDFENKELLLNVFKEMKLNADEIENKTGLKLYFDLNALYSGVMDGVNDENYHSFDFTELAEFCFDTGITKKQPDEISFFYN